MKKAIQLLILAGAFVRACSQEVTPVKMAALEQYIHSAGHPVIINFFSTTCSPCLREMPYLQDSVGIYASGKVELLLVSLDPAASYPHRLILFAAGLKLKVPILWLDEPDKAKLYAGIDKGWSGGIPASLFINNPTGYRRFFDRQITQPQVGMYIRELLGK